MKTFFHYISVIYLFTSPYIYAAHDDHNHDGLPATKQVQGTEGTTCNNLIDVKVNGLVCDFCARALEKTFGKRDDVLGIDVDLNHGKVSIALKENTFIDDATVTKLVTDSGYNVVSIDKGC